MMKVSSLLNILVAGILLATAPVSIIAQTRDTNPLEPDNLLEQIIPQPGSVFDPALNPDHDFIAIPHLKFRIAL